MISIEALQNETGSGPMAYRNGLICLQLDLQRKPSVNDGQMPLLQVAHSAMRLRPFHSHLPMLRELLGVNRKQ